jgi:hypothetical protein
MTWTSPDLQLQIVTGSNCTLQVTLQMLDQYAQPWRFSRAAQIA